jgi:tRNA 2-thiouridine synthesizing protein B
MLYLVDKPMADIAFRTAAGDDDARVVLIQDGVLLEPDLDAPTYAVAEDVDVRGVTLPPDIERISYDTVVEMLVDQEVKSFV